MLELLVHQYRIVNSLEASFYLFLRYCPDSILLTHIEFSRYHSMVFFNPDSNVSIGFQAKLFLIFSALIAYLVEFHVLVGLTHIQVEQDKSLVFFGLRWSKELQISVTTSKFVNSQFPPIL